MRTDIPTLLGLGGTAAIVGIALALGGNQSRFVDPSSIALVVGGTLAVVLARRSLRDFIGHLRSLKVVVRSRSHDVPALLERLRQWSLIARRDGTLALEQQITPGDDGLVNQALMLLVDGANEENIKASLQAHVACLQERHRRVIATWEDWLVVAPSMGMIGTLIGLVQMLGTMHDPAGVGQAMALALLTTLYGALLANIVAGPIASKLQIKNIEELEWCEVLINGASRIARGEGPIKISNAIVTPFPKKRTEAPGKVA
jgi:chemotaxis protein MotA